MVQFRSQFDAQRYFDQAVTLHRQGGVTPYVVEEFDRINTYWARQYIMSLMNPFASSETPPVVDLDSSKLTLGAHADDVCRLRILLIHDVSVLVEGLLYTYPSPLLATVARHGRRDFVNLISTEFRDKVRLEDAVCAAAAASYAGFHDICCYMVEEMKADPTVLDRTGCSAVEHFGRDRVGLPGLSEDDRQNGTRIISQAWSGTGSSLFQPPSVLKNCVKDDFELFHACYLQNLPRIKELVDRDAAVVNRIAMGGYFRAYSTQDSVITDEIGTLHLLPRKLQSTCKSFAEHGGTRRVNPSANGDFYARWISWIRPNGLMTTTSTGALVFRWRGSSYRVALMSTVAKKVPSFQHSITSLTARTSQPLQPLMV